MPALKKLLWKCRALLKKKDASDYNQKSTFQDLPNKQELDPISLDESLSGWFKHATAELIEGFKISPQDVVLDVGCGDSPVMHFCAEQGAKVIFADINAQKVTAMGRMLADSPARSVIPLVCDACSLPIRDALMSKVVAMEVMEHVDNIEVFLNELARVGKPGAQYLITVPDPVAENLQKDLAPPEYFKKPNHIRIIDRDEFEKVVTDAGLIVEQRKFYGFYWAIWWIFFWNCKQDLSSPQHPLLESWTQTWKRLLETQDGARVKRILDNFMPKSQGIIARKPPA